MSTLTASTIRLACNQASRAQTADAATSQPLFIWQGARTALQCALFKALPTAATFVDNISNVVTAELVIRVGSPTGTVLVDKSVPFAAMNGALTFDAWQAGNDAHFEFDLADTDTNQTLTNGELAFYWVIAITTTDSGTIPVAFGNGTIKAPGIGNPGTPTAADYTSYSKAEQDARYAKLGGPNDPSASFYIGAHSRLTPLAGGFKIEVTLDGITWQDGPSYTADGAGSADPAGGPIIFSIGANARLVALTNGFKIQVSADGSTWQDAPSFTAN